MKHIDISTEEKKQEVYDVFNNCQKKGEVYAAFGLTGNKKDIEEVNKISEEIGFNFNIYKERKVKYCIQCGKRLENSQKKFCSSSCAASYNNSKRVLSEETKQKIRETLMNKHLLKKEDEKETPNFCIVCGKELKGKQKKYCSKKCKNQDNLGDVEQTCKYCGSLFKGREGRLYCSNECYKKAEIENFINKWKKEGKVNVDGNYHIPSSIRRYLYARANNKCECCGFEGYNKKTGNSILQIHHIDGNSGNNDENNLQVICPNCHAMTENYMALNKGNSARDKRYKNGIFNK